MAKAAVLQYWLNKLRCKADSLISLQYLKSRFMGLTRCHPLYRSCGSSPWEVEKATTQARLLSGRYRVEALTGHWVPWNKEGFCSLPECWGTQASHKGTVEDFLLSCPSLANARLALAEFSMSFLQVNPHLEMLVQLCLDMDPVQFYLDCSTICPVISAVQMGG